MIMFRGLIFIFSVLDIHNKMGFGSLLGNIAGALGSKFLPIPGVNGGELGGAIGSLLPFKTGGHVKKTGPAYLHQHEFVLPANAKPTKAQRAIVAKNKRDAKKKK